MNQCGLKSRYKGILPKDKPLGNYLKYIEAHVWSDKVLDKYRGKS